MYHGMEPPAAKKDCMLLADFVNESPVTTTITEKTTITMRSSNDIKEN